MLQLSGMWVNFTKDGEQYLTGYMGNLKLVMFKNKFATDNEKAPQWILYVAEKSKEQSQSNVDNLED